MRRDINQDILLTEINEICKYVGEKSGAVFKTEDNLIKKNTLNVFILIVCFMEFDQKNPVIKLCAEGMEMEGKGRAEEAKQLFELAWSQSESDFDKFTSAHYVARHQNSVEEKLKWDSLALEHALRIDLESIKGVLPSLYLNIGKCYEDLDQKIKAIESYDLGLTYCNDLPNDNYGNMIRNGLQNGLTRVHTN